MKRRQVLISAGSALLAPWLTAANAEVVQPTERQKVLRYAFEKAETGFDPAKIVDLYSRIVTGHIFEALYEFDYLARPARVVPNIAVAEPEVADDFKTYTVKIKPGIYFADDPAFKGKNPGKGREVTAPDFVYSFKRFADPANFAGNWSSWEEAGVVGLAEQRAKCQQAKRPFDYDSEIEGLRALDRYTLQFKLRETRPRFVELVLAGNDLSGAVAREVIEFYGDQSMGHPVGTGPFRLAEWRRSSFIALEKNPSYRERYYDAQPAADDANGQTLLARFKGRRLPMLDRVEVSIVEATQPRWLSFLDAEADFIDRVPEEFISQAMPGNHLAPYLAKKGIQVYQTLSATVGFNIFNMDDPVVGGYTPAKIALRRAISLAINVPRENHLVLNDQAIPAQSIVQPFTTSYSNAFKSEAGDYDPARAKALLDMYGYIDRNGDGWREQPDGSPLVIVSNTQSDSLSRQFDEEWQRDLAAVGIKTETHVAQWPENLKNVQAGHFTTWYVNLSASGPDAQGVMQLLYSKAPSGDYARFKLPAFDKLYQQMEAMPDGPARDALFDQAKRIAVAYMPYKVHADRIVTDMAQPWLIGYQRQPFSYDFWQYVDIDTARLPRV